MNNRIIVLVVLIIVLVGGFLYIKSYRTSPVDSMNSSEMTVIDTPAPQNVVEPIATTTATSTATTAKAVRSFTILGSNYAFAPKQLLAKKGDTVTITFQNQSGFHDLHIDAFNVATKQIAAGKSETVTFVATKSGTFEYYCSVGNHRAMGMVGTLTVTE